MTTVRRAWLAAASGAAIVVMSVAGCTPSQPMPVPTEAPRPTSTPGAITVEPELRPGQSAAANQQFFDQLGALYQGSNGMGTSRSLVDFFVENGFEKADIEVTPDVTAINIAADSIVLAVRIKGECLVAQFSASGYSSTIAPVLGTGKCLVGETLPIDW